MPAAGQAGYIYVFRFSACKNTSAGVAMLTTGVLGAILGRLHVLVFAFPLVKIVTRG